MSINPICVWDFTVSFDLVSDYRIIRDYLLKVGKKWAFQQEIGSCGYQHFQGRVSFKVKKRLNEIKAPFTVHWSPTSKHCCTDDFYVTKEDTRVNGPWTSSDEIIYIPRQIREIKTLRPWQQSVLNLLQNWDTRRINLVYCPNGNIGKSILVGWCRAYKLARALPPCNDHKDIMRMVCDLPTAKSYIIDMPRSMNKDRLYGFYSGIETIKDGFAYDDRYSYKEKVFDCPNVWIFSNTLPDEEMLSRDRWKIWEVIEEKLEEYKKSIFDIISDELDGNNYWG